MGAASPAFPDLDLTLAVSRVEVVSNVEIETIKTALRWLFDEAQSQRKAAAAADTIIPQTHMDELDKIVQHQKASLQALQQQQVNDATYAVVSSDAICSLKPHSRLLIASLSDPHVPNNMMTISGIFLLLEHICISCLYAQEKLLQSSQLSEQALGPLKEVPDALRKLQEGQESAAGTSFHASDCSSAQLSADAHFWSNRSWPILSFMPS